MIKKKLLTLTITSLAVLSFSVGFNDCYAKETKIAVQTTTMKAKSSYEAVNPLTLINVPNKFINHKIKINATFDKFSTLGLDYKPAFRDSKKYLSFLIQRHGIAEHTIPLSELKLMVKRDIAESLIELESGDQIEFTGTVFSTALNDPWVEVDKITVISSKSEKLKDKIVTEKSAKAEKKKAEAETKKKNKKK